MILFLCYKYDYLMDSGKCSTYFQALIYKEFFSEGDMEKAQGKRPPSSFDRERVEIPTHQISFIDKVAMPVYK